MKQFLSIVLSVGLTLTIFTSCGDTQQTKTSNINDSDTSHKSNTINHDSLAKALFKFGEPYFKSNSIDSIVALNGKPKYVSKIQWGDNERDSLLTVGYDFLKFNFWVGVNSKPQLESVYLLDSKITLAGNLCIGKTTRQDILQNLGLPDSDHNDPGRSVTKSGDTTSYGTQSGAG